MKLLSFCLALSIVPLFAAQVSAQKFKQTYYRSDGEVVKADDVRLWSKRSAKGLPDFLVSQYSATEKSGVLVRRDMLVYFPNAPVANDVDRSNWWVYWYNEKTGKIWGRCPTPKHPQFKQLQQQAKGEDLWQLLPKERQVAGFETQLLRLPEVAKGFGQVISSEATNLPKVRADIDDVIECVPFNNPVFR